MGLGSLRPSIVGEVVVGYRSGSRLSQTKHRGGSGGRVIVVDLCSLTAKTVWAVVVG